MKYMCTLLAVRDIEASKKFYTELLGMKVTMDLGANVSLDDRLALQTLDTWADFLDTTPDTFSFGDGASELVFEVEDLDAFLEKVKSFPGVELVHEVKEFPWGQRVLRLCDPDRHYIEVGEDMKVVVKRQMRNGRTDEQVLENTGFPAPFIAMCRAELEEETRDA